MARDIPAPSRDRPVLPSIRSFTRFEPAESSKPSRLRASTVQSEALGPAGERDGTSYAVSPGRASQMSPDDIFDKNSKISPIPGLEQSLNRAQSLPARFDELPVELASLTDR